MRPEAVCVRHKTKGAVSKQKGQIGIEANYVSKKEG